MPTMEELLAMRGNSGAANGAPVVTTAPAPPRAARTKHTAADAAAANLVNQQTPEVAFANTQVEIDPVTGEVKDVPQDARPLAEVQPVDEVFENEQEEKRLAAESEQRVNTAYHSLISGMSPDEQYRLAQLIAANVGYSLVADAHATAYEGARGPEHIHFAGKPAVEGMHMALRVEDLPTVEQINARGMG